MIRHSAVPCRVGFWRSREGEYVPWSPCALTCSLHVRAPFASLFTLRSACVVTPSDVRTPIPPTAPRERLRTQRRLGPAVAIALDTIPLPYPPLALHATAAGTIQDAVNAMGIANEPPATPVASRLALHSRLATMEDAQGSRHHFNQLGRSLSVLRFREWQKVKLLKALITPTLSAT